MRLTNQVAGLRKLTPEELLEELPRTVQDPILPSLLEQLAQAESNLAAAKQHLGPNSEELVQTNKTVVHLRSLVENRAQAILAGMEDKNESLKVRFQQLQEEVNRKQQHEIKLVDQSRLYREKKAQIEKLEHLGDALRGRSLREPM